MSEEVSNVQPVESSQGQSPATSRPNVDAKTTFVSNANDLKEKAPEVFKAMTESIARRICDELRSHAERMKKIMREGQRQG